MWALFVFACCSTVADEPQFNDRKLSEWLVMLKEDPVARKRRGAVVALGAIAAGNEEAFPTAIGAVGRALVNDASPVVRLQAATVLGQQKVEPAAIALTDLTNAMRQERDPTARREIAVTIGRFGKLAKVAVSAVADGLKDQDLTVRAAAADALGRIGAEAAETAPALLPLLKSDNKPLKQAVIFALGRIDAEEKAPIALAITEILKTTTDVELQREVMVSLSFLNDTSGDVLPTLAKQLKNPDVEHRLLTLTTLSKLGPSVLAVRAELMELLKTDPDKNIRVMAIRVLAKVSLTKPGEVLELLGERLRSDRDFEARVAIAEEIGAMGAVAKSAIPNLRQAQRDPQIQVREAATKAIRRIESPTPKPMPKP
ncbi:MAG: HEAT repeat domain-containing protein [Fimbriiglobus sp.]